MPDHDNEPFAGERALVYTIRVQGILDATWSEWFDGMEVRSEADDTTVLTGRVVDQAALHRVIRTIRDLGLPLISLQRSRK